MGQPRLLHDGLKEQSMTKALSAFAIITGAAFLMAGAVHAQAERSGEQIVKSKCITCHGTGVQGAPRIDDRAAWAPRMKMGVDATVRSAIKGHGGMPARGGMADLTDTELRAAILYMFNPAGASAKDAAKGAPAPRDFNRQVVGDTEIFLGVMPAKASGNYDINISLRDAATQQPIKDAKVEARVAGTMGGSTKILKRTVLNDTVSYQNSFRMLGNETHVVTVKVIRPHSDAPVEAKFNVKH
jgi:cytochrome c5